MDVATVPPVARTNRGYGDGLSYGRLRAEELPLGTSAWWRAIDHEGHDGGSQ